MRKEAKLHALKDLRLAVIGLGYVGFPLAIEFGKHRSVIGFDIDKKRIQSLSKGIDITNEVDEEDFKLSKKLELTSNESKLSSANCFIVTVPTPIDSHKKPDLSLMIQASKTVGSYLKRGDIVIYESTVYPGVTEEVCVIELEKSSKLKFNRDFYVGYSPERINPGDKEHRLPNICKITSGSTPKASKLIDALYKEIVVAGTYNVESIRIAEAAKVIENTQRDINIALINELAVIFDKMGIDTESVLKAAGSKWNFLSFYPGLVGGHCIGVDPYYLLHKAESLGYLPQIITAGRRMNDEMPSFVVSKLLKTMLARNIQVKDARILILGLAFKEDCPDIRNTGVFGVIKELKECNLQVDVFDPLVDFEEAKKQYGVSLIEYPEKNCYTALILAVKHKIFIDIPISELKSFCLKEHIIFDLKYSRKEKVDLRL